MEEHQILFSQIAKRLPIQELIKTREVTRACCLKMLSRMDTQLQTFSAYSTIPTVEKTLIINLRHQRLLNIFLNLSSTADVSERMSSFQFHRIGIQFIRNTWKFVEDICWYSRAHTALYKLSRVRKQ